MIQPNRINWNAFKADLQLLKKNEHLWAYASFGSREKKHLEKEKRIKDDISSIDKGDYKSVISHYSEETFKNYIL